MLVKRFGFPEEDVVQIVWICAGFLFAIICIAAPVAFVSRWLADRSEQDYFDELEKLEEKRDKAVEQASDAEKKELS